jgi:hypothetical protein
MSVAPKPLSDVQMRKLISATEDITAAQLDLDKAKKVFVTAHQKQHDIIELVLDAAGMPNGTIDLKDGVIRPAEQAFDTNGISTAVPSTPVPKDL